MSHDELLLLGLLAQQRMHGYELHEFIERRLHLISDLTKPTAYRLLESLYQRGLVDRHAERSGRRPERLVYELTPAGGERLVALVREQLARADRVVYRGDAALLFADQLPAAERRRLLAARRDEAAEAVALLREMRDLHPAGTPAHRVLDHDLAHLVTEVQWLDAEIAGFDGSIPKHAAKSGSDDEGRAATPTLASD